VPVYRYGGNPLHHHQDLARLHEAFTRPETVVVHDPFCTATPGTPTAAPQPPEASGVDPSRSCAGVMDHCR